MIKSQFTTNLSPIFKLLDWWFSSDSQTCIILPSYHSDKNSDYCSIIIRVRTMADCSGVTGTAIDRAAQAIVGHGGGNIGKDLVSGMLGHGIRQQQQHPFTSLPTTAPTQLPEPPAAAVMAAAAATTTTSSTSIPSWMENSNVAVTPNYIARPLQHQHPAILPPGSSDASFSHDQSSAPFPLHRMMQHHHNFGTIASMQQSHQHMALLQQQQAAMMIQHQQRQILWMQQQQNQMLQQQKQRATVQDRNVVERGHEGIIKPVSIEELAVAWADVQQQEEQHGGTVGHEGSVQPAGIEELAAAWAKAQVEYGEDEDPSNLWSGAERDGNGEYQFQTPRSEGDPQQPQPDWMAEGMREFERGNIRAAMAAFENEIRNNNPDNATAWRYLGKCHAENDMDREAIQCLEQAVDRDPYNAEALLDLGVSYVNELNHDAALKNLKAWITHNPKFAGLEVGDDLYGSSSLQQLHDSSSAFDEVQRLLLSALEYHAIDQNHESSPRADILEALGVVYNVSRDYEAAVDALRQACALRPNDYQLWNKLGATLANSNKCEEALVMYTRALQIKPKYARAWLNMAISYSNLNQYDEAARCYLQTLSLNPTAVHCWSYLRIALSTAERLDLLPLAASQNLYALHDHYDFVLYDEQGNPS
jgi:peroxin-5